MLDAVELDLVARILPKNDPIAIFDRERTQLAVLLNLAVADGDHQTLDRLFLRRVRDDDASLGFGFLGDALYNDAVRQRSNFHGANPRAVDHAPKRREV